MNDIVTISKTDLEDILRQAAAPRYVKGIDGLCEIFGCSPSTAKRIKKGGTINKAIHQQGRTFLTNVDLAIELFGARNGRHI